LTDYHLSSVENLQLAGLLNLSKTT